MNEDKKQEMIDSVTGMLMNIVSDYTKRVPVSFEELEQAALIRLNRAVEMFQPDKGVPWAMYAKHHIRGGCLDLLREIDTVSRDARRHAVKIDAAQHAIEQRFMRNATQSEIAEELGVSMTELAERQSAVNPVYSIEAITQLDTQRRGAGWEPTAPSKPDECAWQEIKKLLDDATLNCLTPRYRRVLEMYYLQNVPMHEIGDIMGVNETRISQMLKLARQKLRAEFASRGYSRVDQLLPRAA